MPPAHDAWRVESLEDQTPGTPDVDARLRVLKALEREYEVFLRYQAEIETFQEPPVEVPPVISQRWGKR
jgi:hypothetical protein